MFAKIFFYTILIVSFAFGCQTKIKPLQEQAMDSFVGRVLKVDPLLRLDSFEVASVDTMTEQTGRIIEDSIYSKEYGRIETQLNNAIISNKKDSIDFLKYELDYMKKEMDSLTGLIKSADPKKKFGFIISLLYKLRKNDKAQKDTVYFFMDSIGNIVNSKMIDIVIQKSYERMK
jgi:hypothetical protein